MITRYYFYSGKVSAGGKVQEFYGMADSFSFFPVPRSILDGLKQEVADMFEGDHQLHIDTFQRVR